MWSESECGLDVDLVLMPMLEGSDHAEGWVWSWDAKREQAEMVGGRESDASKHARDGKCSHKQPCTDLQLDRISVQVSFTLRTYRSMFILKLISLATSVWALGCKYICVVVREYFENLSQNVLGRFCAKCVQNVSIDIFSISHIRFQQYLGQLFQK